MKKILIGSRAIKHWFPDFPREPKDTDYIVGSLSEKLSNDKPSRVEYHFNPILDYYPGEVLNPDLIYTLKISHLFWDIKWEKHMFDIQFLRKKGCRIIIDEFRKLVSYWEKVHGPMKRSDLELSSEEFFDNALKEYDHDYLHMLINPYPTYKKILRDGFEVAVDESKFKLLTHHEKLSLVREEVYVMAYERLAGRDYRTAYSWMLKKFIMHHAPMWEAIWIIENYVELHKPVFNYKQKIDYELQRNLREA
jgi:hypothetical protein